MPDAVIEASGITKSFGSGSDATSAVLNGVSLVIDRGELVAIVGPSGSGKSTLLYCLSGLESPTSGSVRLLGNELVGLKPGRLAKLRRDHVGFVFQSYNLIPSLTARENVALTARLSKQSVNSAQDEAALSAVHMTDSSNKRPASLSGGQQQRIAIARVLAIRPDVVFADEPTGALDTAAGSDVLDLLRAVATGGQSVVMVTHDLEAAARADRVLVLRDGYIHTELRNPTAQEVLNAVTRARNDVHP